jgi:hypothetical protein
MLNKYEFNSIFVELENSRPIVKLVRGNNNKEEYYLSDRIYEILKHYCKDKSLIIP